MTAFNREEFIANAIESVLASSLEQFELIVVDDASSDGTLSVAKRYQQRDSRVKVWSNATNLGDYPNRNKAASYASGTYIKFLDSDDVIYSHGLAAMVSCMERFPQSGFGLSAVPDTNEPYPQLVSPHDAYLEHYFRNDLLARAPGSSIIRRFAFESVGGFSGTRQVGDHELWLTLASRFPLVKMPTDLVWDRQHAAQEKRFDDNAEKAAMHDEIRLAALLSKDCPLDASERAAAAQRQLKSQADTYWTLLRHDGKKSADKYRRRMKLPLDAVLTAAFNRAGKKFFMSSDS
jgi:glycosyltransferase involved in cell wall biosynthesis